MSSSPRSEAISSSPSLSRKRPSETRIMMATAPLSSSSPGAATTTTTSQPTTTTTTTTTSSSLSIPPQRRLVVRLQRYHGVARWSWNANDDVCGICQAAFEGTAPDVKLPGEDCPVVWGKCGHAFHLQCVSKWLTTTSQASSSNSSSKNSCPICRQEWEFGSNPGTATNHVADSDS